MSRLRKRGFAACGFLPPLRFSGQRHHRARPAQGGGQKAEGGRPDQGGGGNRARPRRGGERCPLCRPAGGCCGHRGHVEFTHHPRRGTALLPSGSGPGGFTDPLPRGGGHARLPAAFQGARRHAPHAPRQPRASPCGGHARGRPAVRASWGRWRSRGHECRRQFRRPVGRAQSAHRLGSRGTFPFPHPSCTALPAGPAPSLRASLRGRPDGAGKRGLDLPRLSHPRAKTSQAS